MVITDGRANVNEADTQRRAREARDDGIELYVIGVGDSTDMNEINGIASDPDEDHVFSVRDIDDIEDESAALLDRLCL